MESWILSVAGRLLRLPPRALCTACTYLQHYQQRKHHPEMHLAAAAEPDSKMLVAACLLLASKVEEAAVSNNHLLNLVSMLHELLIVHHIPPSRILGAQQTCLEAATSHACHTEGAAAGTGAAGADPRHKSSAPAAAPAAPPPPHTQQGMNTGAVENGATQQQQQQYRYVQQQQQCPQQQRHVDAPTHDLQLALSRCQVLVGDAYYAAKSQLLLAEQVVLRLLRFRLPTPHPTAALLHIAAMLRVPAILASASLCLLHDAATFSTVLLPLPPSGRSTNALGLSNTTKRSRVGPHAWTSNCQPDRQDGQQGVRRRGAGGSEDSKEEGWGVVAEEDELEGRALLAALMANSQCMPSVGQVVANSRRLPSIGQADGQGPHALPHTGAQQTQTQDPSAAGQGVGARIQQTRSPAVGSHSRSLLREGVPLIPEGRGSDHLHMELHEVLVGAACLHLAMCLLDPNQQQQEPQAQGNSPRGVGQQQQQQEQQQEQREPQAQGDSPRGVGQQQRQQQQRQEPQGQGNSPRGVGKQQQQQQQQQQEPQAWGSSPRGADHRQQEPTLSKGLGEQPPQRICDPGASGQPPEVVMLSAAAELQGNGRCPAKHTHQHCVQHQPQQQPQATSSMPLPPAAVQHSYVLYPPSTQGQGQPPHQPQPPPPALQHDQGQAQQLDESTQGVLRQPQMPPTSCLSPQPLHLQQMRQQQPLQGQPLLGQCQQQPLQGHCTQAPVADPTTVGLCGVNAGEDDGNGGGGGGGGDRGRGCALTPNPMQASGADGCSVSADAGCGGVSGSHPCGERHAGRERRYRERGHADRECPDAGDGGDKGVDVGVTSSDLQQAGEVSLVAHGAYDAPISKPTLLASLPHAPAAAAAAAAPAPAVLPPPALPPLPLWARAFGVDPEAVQAVAAVVLGAIARTKRELAALENQQQRH